MRGWVDGGRIGGFVSCILLRDNVRCSIEDIIEFECYDCGWQYDDS